jgi:HSP20 family protein
MDKPQARRETVKLKVAYGENLGALEKAIQEAIAYRAYEHFSGRGRGHGHDLEDWFQAESDLAKPEGVQISEAGGQWIVQARAPGFRAEELQVGASPCKVIVWGQAVERQSTGTKSSRQLLGEIELPSAIIPEKAIATLSGDSLEVRVAKEPA